MHSSVLRFVRKYKDALDFSLFAKLVTRESVTTAVCADHEPSPLEQ
jgi:hypothetical protein